MQPAETVGHLAVQAHRVDEPRGADDARVRGDEQDRRGEDADVDLPGRLQRAEVQVLDDPEHRVPGVAALRLARAEQRLVGAVGLFGDGQRRQRDHRQQRVDREHGGDDRLDRARDRVRLVHGLLGHVRDRLDARIGDHPDRDRDEEVFPRRRDAEVDVVDQHVRREHEHDADGHEQQLRREVGDREHDVQPRGLLDADDVDDRQHRHHADAEDDVAGRVLQRRPEQPPEVVGHEERRDGDRDRVVEHLRPRGEERPQLVEGVAREGGGAAGLGEHRRRLGVGRGRQVEDPAGDDEDDRREAERVGGDQAERVVDRGADVAVGGREQRARAEHPPQSVLGEPSHRPAAYRRRRPRRARMRPRRKLARGPMHATSHAPQSPGQEAAV